MDDAPAPIERFPGGCFLLMNSMINWEAAEKLVAAAGQALQAGFPQITLCITSSGGNVEHAFYAFNILRALPLRVVTYNAGSVRSAANILFMAGDERLTTPGATFFFHETWFDGTGPQNTASVSKRLQSIQADDERSVALLARETGQPESAVRAWVARDATIGSAEAVQLGIAQRVEPLVIPAQALIERIIVT